MQFSWKWRLNIILLCITVSNFDYNEKVGGYYPLFSNSVGVIFTSFFWDALDSDSDKPENLEPRPKKTLKHTLFRIWTF